MPVAAAVAAAGALSAGASIYGASQAASAQKKAAQLATNAQMQMFNTTQANLKPFIGGGGQAFGQLQGLTGTNAGGNPLTAPLTAPFQPTIQQLQQTPGYQFTLDQGLKNVQNSYASRGLASSGAAMKGGLDYAEGLASTTYQQQFQNYLAQNQQIYNMLLGQSQLGESAAAGQGQIAQATGQNIGQNILGAGNAQAASSIAGANAIGGAPTNALLSYMLLNNSGMFGQQGGGGGMPQPVNITPEVQNPYPTDV